MASANEILLKVKGFFEDKISTQVNATLGKVDRATKGLQKGMAGLSSAMDGLGGTVGKVSGAVGNMVQSFMLMGPVGAVIAAVGAAIALVQSKAEKAAENMLKLEREGLARVQKRLAELKTSILDSVNDKLETATTNAEQAAKAFETMATNYNKLSAAKDATASLTDSAMVAQLRLQKQGAMAGAADANAAARVGAQYDITIAQTKKAQSEEKYAKEVDRAKEALSQDEMRAAAARQKLREVDAALAKAKEEQANGEAQREIDPAYGRQLDQAVKRAEKAKFNAEQELAAAEGNAKVSAEKVTQAELQMVTALTDAEREVQEARKSAKDLAEAQKRAADAEAKRQAEADAAAQRKRQAEAVAEKRSALAALDQRRQAAEGMRSAAASRFETAFDLWRDPEAAQGARDAAEKRAEDMRAFRKAVGGYSGKWRIDEAARLMREGDEAGLNERLEQWRKGSKFDAQTEQMVLAAAAEQNKGQAERDLAEIAENTRDLSKKLDDLLKVK